MVPYVPLCRCTQYCSVTEDEALSALADFDKRWGKQYLHIAKSWQNNWQNLVVFLQYPEVIRRIIYTANTIKGLNSQLRILSYLIII